MAPLLQTTFTPLLTPGGRVVHIINARIRYSERDLIGAVVVSVFGISNSVAFKLGQAKTYEYQLQVVPLSGPKEEMVCH
jgi:hypothetical protein